MSTYCDTAVGHRKDRNEDCVRYTPLPNAPHDLVAVADGMGGPPDGDVASEVAIATLVGSLASSDVVQTAPGDALETAYRRANRAVAERTADAGSAPPGTTLVAALVDGEDAVVANVGDSRAYRVNDALERVTVDHSYVQRLVESGELEPEEADDHPMSHVLDQALGTSDGVDVDVFHTSLTDARLLLCSDGLTDPVSEETIQRVCLESETLADAGGTLIERALDAGAPDNVSVALYQPD
ncbi:serine/threonine-protein phosphatase (plasmid) [Halarchaeum sp. CBA1220]|uniref:PP2C family protein-serine/threonine phosphatase n=1 Tax=Halarchaeum sp. CBA1220 TaxID=1853682 RepID=UPI000F3A94F3|nr:protein phosphatase 2C domain-containing protein [Halarchaeum sp. CBA1220]QLC35566.1 serine/threonine-protein phosphatase [Halarchaeum sp. CBA1220]